MKSICKDLYTKGKDIYTGWGVPILSRLLGEVHVHDYAASPLKGHTHTLICQTCGFQTKENCQTYRILEDGSIVCRDCQTPVISRFEDGVLTVAEADQAYINFPGLSTAGAEHFRNHAIPIELRLEEGYRSIPSYSFADFPGLIRVILPSTVDNLCNHTFRNDPDLEYVDMSNTRIMNILEKTFMDSGNAQHPLTVLFPKELVYIGYAAFRGSSIAMLDLTETAVSSLDNEVFSDCTSLTRVKLTKNVGWMGHSVFDNCSKLKEINFEDTGMAWMPDRCFRNCSALTELTLPREFYSIYSDSFAGCTGLKKLNFLGNAPEFYDYERELGIFGKDKLTVYYPNNKTWNTIKNNTKKYQFGGKVTWKSYDPNTYIPAISLKLTATAPYNYGAPVMPKFTLKNGKKHVLVEGTDYTITCKNNTKIGAEAYATIKGIGDYSGTRKIYYKIVPIPISKVILSETLYPYDGEIHMPSVTVMAGDVVLLEKGLEGNEQVELSMKADTSTPGTYTVTAKGLGIYAGSKKAKYKITVCPVVMTKVGAVSKGFKASWNSLPEEPITGYQIQYDMDEAVLNKNKGTMVNVENPAAASKKVTGLKGKTTYYVKMRTYLVLGEKTYYSEWTEVKAVTAKK